MSSSGGTPYALPGQVITGTGSPLGVVTPSGPGVLYLDRAQTNGAAQWVSTGTTDGAWSVTQGDTGWLNVASLLNPADFAPSSSNGGCLLRRTGPLVSFECNVNVITSGQTILFSLPAGFSGSPQEIVQEPGIMRTASAANNGLPSTFAQWYLGGAGGSIRSAAALPSPGTVMITGSWTTEDPWPTGPLP